jgi:hypothetical protein
MEPSSTQPADELDAMLADIAAAVEDARVYQREHGLTDTATRKLPSAVLHTLSRWRQRTKELAER